jgi:very-short-patch-repair endonuclease
MPHRILPRDKLFRARALRGNMTDAEKRIWFRLRAHRFDGASFRRQFPIGAYVVDFVCLESRLIVEIDGGQHSENQKDTARDAWLRSQGFRVLRFWNHDVLSNTEGVLEQIAKATQDAPPSLTLPRKGGRNAPSKVRER